MIALFLRAELASERWRDALHALLDRAGLPERVITDPDLDDPVENQARRRLLTGHRGYDTRDDYFDGFPDDVCWEWMGISPAELTVVRYIEYDYWVELSGGTRLPVDAAARIRAGVTVFGVSNDRVLRMARAVAGGARFPPLILATTTPPASLVVLEGHARLTALMLCPGRLPPEMEVLVGSSPRMAGWDCWQQARHSSRWLTCPGVRAMTVMHARGPPETLGTPAVAIVAPGPGFRRAGRVVAVAMMPSPAGLSVCLPGAPG